MKRGSWLGRLRQKFHKRLTGDPDARVLEVLNGAGVDRSVPRTVDLELYFPTETAANNVADLLAKRGCITEVSLTDEPGIWHVTAQQSMMLTLEALAQARAECEAIAAQYGGEFDGWGVSVV